MESLALIVALIFLTLISSGPLSLTLWYFNFKILAFISAVACLLLGGFWISVTPIPVSVIGYLEIMCGLFVIFKILNKF